MARERGNNARGMSNSERESTLNQLLVEVRGRLNDWEWGCVREIRLY